MGPQSAKVVVRLGIGGPYVVIRWDLSVVGGSGELVCCGLRAIGEHDAHMDLEGQFRGRGCRQLRYHGPSSPARRKGERNNEDDTHRISEMRDAVVDTSWGSSEWLEDLQCRFAHVFHQLSLLRTVGELSRGKCGGDRYSTYIGLKMAIRPLANMKMINRFKCQR